VGHRLDSRRSIQPTTHKDPDTSADLAGLRALRARHGSNTLQHLNQFCQKLPQNVIVGGEVVNVRESIAAMPQQPVANIFAEIDHSFKIESNHKGASVNDDQSVDSQPQEVTSPQYILVVRQPKGDTLPKMKLSSETTVAEL
jgi:hypothetical protein